MADRKSFLMRVDREVLSAVEKWAADDLRSVNAQVEFILRSALRKAGRLKKTKASTPPPTADSGQDSED